MLGGREARRAYPDHGRGQEPGERCSRTGGVAVSCPCPRTFDSNMKRMNRTLRSGLSRYWRRMLTTRTPHSSGVCAPDSRHLQPLGLTQTPRTRAVGRLSSAAPCGHMPSTLPHDISCSLRPRPAARLVAVGGGLVRTALGDANVFGLVGGELGEPGAELAAASTQRAERAEG